MRSILLLLALSGLASAAPASVSGIYPSLAMFNNEDECGTGAVVPWQDRLWVVTYAPHAPTGSSDKLYEITPDLDQIVRPESIGGTPANRMIHDESQQLFIGPYAIDSKRNVRAIPYSDMYGRPTGTTRSLSDPAGKVVYATMEEGIYEVDVKSLKATELWADEQVKTTARKANLPGYHGKGFHTGQGVYVYANNGDHAREAITNPNLPSGVLAEWDGKADQWTVIRRNQFTEVTGPGGIHGSKNPATDPIWTVGWDFKSLIFGVREPSRGWTFYRLPKGSHSYDGAHGWNTEWPRIREIGGDDFLMTMHGTFWKFPKTFGTSNAAGIRPRSNYIKVIGDFCQWNDKLVFACDDTARSEFANKSKLKGDVAAPQSQSNLWFVDEPALDHFGPAIGRGAVWSREDLAAGAVSDPYLFAGYDCRALHLTHTGGTPVTFTLETGSAGGKWTKLQDVEVPANGQRFIAFETSAPGEWIRVRTATAAKGASAVFSYRAIDSRPETADAIFDGIAATTTAPLGGLVRARAENKRTLSLAAVKPDGTDAGYYELDGDLKLRAIDSPTDLAYAKKNTAIPSGTIQRDEASAIFTDEAGRRWRLPSADVAYQKLPLGDFRVVREVSTERNLLNVDGTFYELPANNAGGAPKMRAVSTHHRAIHDFASFRGMVVMTGIAPASATTNPHIIRSDDRKAAVWAGTIDDLWKFGKPRGQGGPWKNSAVKAGTPSDPYLLTGFDHKSLVLASSTDATLTAQIDVTGEGQWVDYQAFKAAAGKSVAYEFPDAFSAYWIRFVSDQDTTASATLTYR